MTTRDASITYDHAREMKVFAIVQLRGFYRVKCHAGSLGLLSVATLYEPALRRCRWETETPSHAHGLTGYVGIDILPFFCRSMLIDCARLVISSGAVNKIKYCAMWKSLSEKPRSEGLSSLLFSDRATG